MSPLPRGARSGRRRSSPFLSGVLTLLSNALTVQIAAQGPELMALYRMDNFHVWKLLFGFFLVYVLWQAWRRRRAN